jgi:hypothetical protein
LALDNLSTALSLPEHIVDPIAEIDALTEMGNLNIQKEILLSSKKIPDGIKILQQYGKEEDIANHSQIYEWPTATWHV